MIVTDRDAAHREIDSASHRAFRAAELTYRSTVGAARAAALDAELASRRAAELTYRADLRAAGATASTARANLAAQVQA